MMCTDSLHAFCLDHISKLTGPGGRREYLNASFNFETFGYSMVMLFRLATNDGWAAIAQDCAVQPPLCSREEGNCGPSSLITNLFFVIFVALVSIIMLNLFTTVILDQFEELQVRTHSPTLL